jgi:hypothetical protein
MDWELFEVWAQLFTSQALGWQESFPSELKIQPIVLVDSCSPRLI